MNFLLPLALGCLSALPAMASPKPLSQPVVSQGIDLGFEGKRAALQLGQNVRLGRMILGLQADLATDLATGERSPCILSQRACEAQFSASAGLTSRIGVMATDRTILYLDAGLRQGKVTAVFPGAGCGDASCTLTADQTGWDMDAGIAVSLNPQVPMRANIHRGERQNAAPSLLVAERQRISGWSVSLTASF